MSAELKCSTFYHICRRTPSIHLCGSDGGDGDAANGEKLIHKINANHKTRHSICFRPSNLCFLRMHARVRRPIFIDKNQTSKRRRRECEKDYILSVGHLAFGGNGETSGFCGAEKKRITTMITTILTTAHKTCILISLNDGNSHHTTNENIQQPITGSSNHHHQQMTPQPSETTKWQFCWKVTYATHTQTHRHIASIRKEWEMSRVEWRRAYAYD